MDTAKLGAITIYTGEGRGKSSAALGLALRAVGEDKRVMIIYFDKNENTYTERYVLNKLEGDVDYQVLRLEFTDPATGRWRSDFTSQDFDAANEGLLAAKRVASDGKHDLLILDEVNPVLSAGLIDLPAFLAFVESKPAHLQLIMTGQNCPDQVKKIADRIVELKEL